MKKTPLIKSIILCISFLLVFSTTFITKVSGQQASEHDFWNSYDDAKEHYDDVGDFVYNLGTGEYYSADELLAILNDPAQRSEFESGLLYDKELWSPSEASQVLDLLAANDVDGAFELFWSKYGSDIYASSLGSGGGDLAASTVGSSGKTSQLVFDQLVIPTTKTKAEKKKAALAAKVAGMPRIFGTNLRYEDVEFEDAHNDGDIYGLTLGLAWDQDDFSFGVMIPYDYLDFDDLLEADRAGLIVFGQWHKNLNQNTTLNLMANANYMYTDIDFDRGDDEDVNTYGGGLSTSITMDMDSFVPTLGVSYQYNTDDTDVEDDEQHLIKTGLNVGFRLGENAVLDVYGIWNWDVTDYEDDSGDDDYFDVGAELALDLSETWSLNTGYKKVLDLNNFDSDLYYLGTLWRF